MSGIVIHRKAVCILSFTNVQWDHLTLNQHDCHLSLLSCRSKESRKWLRWYWELVVKMYLKTDMVRVWILRSCPVYIWRYFCMFGLFSILYTQMSSSFFINCMLIWKYEILYVALVAELFCPIRTHYKFNFAILRSGTFLKDRETIVMVVCFILEIESRRKMDRPNLFGISLDLLGLWPNGRLNMRAFSNFVLCWAYRLSQFIRCTFIISASSVCPDRKSKSLLSASKFIH